jgi:hypothetical protein
MLVMVRRWVLGFGGRGVQVAIEKVSSVSEGVVGIRRKMIFKYAY